MDFLEFLNKGATSWAYDKIVFNGNAFRFRSDVFPKFEVVGSTYSIREFSLGYTDYSLSPIANWGGAAEYFILKSESPTGYSIKINGDYVELYRNGYRC